MKTYKRMQAGMEYAEADLPKVVRKRKDEFLSAGLIEETASGIYMKPEAKEEDKPTWVEAAEDAVASPEGEEQQQAMAPAVTQFGIVLGNRAAAIVQLCDALQNGTAGLQALGDIRGNAMMILYDLNLLRPEPENEVAESD
tara:strand:- start:170 stop:592 length:423 start_codon:yes stop_codon:yes gene_type:complete